MEHISRAYEDYLEAIYELSPEGGQGRSVDVAEKLGVTKVSVGKAVKALKEAGLAEQPFYGDITLTKRGADYGRSVLARHRMLRTFLIDLLGVDPETAEDEACRLEHDISQDTVEKWTAFVRQQGVDPMGSREKTHASHQPRNTRQERSAAGAKSAGETRL